jgi:aminodeoxyfutalosine synthase
VDGTVHEYEITYQDEAPGERHQVLTRQQMIEMILEAGRIPVERDSHYNEVPPRPGEKLLVVA